MFFSPDPTYSPKCPFPNDFIIIFSCHILVWVAKADPLQTDVRSLSQFFQELEVNNTVDVMT